MIMNDGSGGMYVCVKVAVACIDVLAWYPREKTAGDY
jgi:hypothetical protein